jgi:hypothetical protein
LASGRYPPTRVGTAAARSVLRRSQAPCSRRARLGRYSRLILDSWTRPKYARVNGRKAADRTIERRFRRYGDYAGLAFWLYLTRDWVAG